MKPYKYSHSVSAGGWHFIQRTKSGKNIFTGKVAERISLQLEENLKFLRAQDVTIKMCGNHFHVFCHIAGMHAPITFINTVRITADYALCECGTSEELDGEYILGGISDLSREWIAKEMKKIGEEL
jgi:REP element-mobilizing transposase RayT